MARGIKGVKERRSRSGLSLIGTPSLAGMLAKPLSIYGGRCGCGKGYVSWAVGLESEGGLSSGSHSSVREGGAETLGFFGAAGLKKASIAFRLDIAQCQL